MADRLYLSLWYSNFRLETLPAALTGVLRQFAVIGGKRVAAAAAYPVNFSEAPVYQRIYVLEEAAAAQGGGQMTGLVGGQIPDSSDSIIENAVSEATEQLHDDMAYEFEMRWQLWAPDSGDFGSNRLDSEAEADGDPDDARGLWLGQAADIDRLETSWRLGTHTVRVLGFGPHFDMAGYEQNGHLLVDFGLDTPWVLDAGGATAAEDEALDEIAQRHIQQNVEKLLAFTLLVEKHCGISSRLLWTESGEPLAEKLIARLQRVH